MIVLPNGKNINPGDIESGTFQADRFCTRYCRYGIRKKIGCHSLSEFELMKARGIHNVNETLKWDIIDKYNVNAPSYQKIHDIKVVKEELPKTKMGKIRRFLLPDLLKKQEQQRNDEEEKKTTLQFPAEYLEEYTILQEYLEGSKGEKVYPDSHLEIDLVDSLDMVEM